MAYQLPDLFTIVLSCFCWWALMNCSKQSYKAKVLPPHRVQQEALCRVNSSSEDTGQVQGHTWNGTFGFNCCQAMTDKAGGQGTNTCRATMSSSKKLVALVALFWVLRYSLTGTGEVKLSEAEFWLLRFGHRAGKPSVAHCVTFKTAFWKKIGTA